MIFTLRQRSVGDYNGTVSARLITACAVGLTLAVSGCSSNQPDGEFTDAHVGSDAATIDARVQPDAAPWISSLTETARLIANDASTGDQFGISVAVAGGLVAVGAHWADLPDGDGAAYVFQRDGSDAWPEVKRLVPGDIVGTAFAHFGYSLSYCDADLVVSAFAERAPGASAHVFDSKAWMETNKLLGSDGVLGDDFGWSLACNAGRLVVGAPWHGDATNSVYPGAAYVFEQDGPGSWNEVEKVMASDGGLQDRFGLAVATEGDYIAIGAPSHWTDRLTGAVYIFVRQPSGDWVESQKLVPADAAHEDQFGTAVAMTANVLMVGADLDDDLTGAAGSVYVYERDGAGSWVEAQKLHPTYPAYLGRFGNAIAMDGDLAVIGTQIGQAYVFRRDAAGTWSAAAALVATASTPGDDFGIAVDIDGTDVVVGAYGDEHAGFQSGAAYVFDVSALGPLIPGDLPQLSP